MKLEGFMMIKKLGTKHKINNIISFKTPHVFATKALDSSAQFIWSRSEPSDPTTR